ncbi:hypothetical protein QTI66_12405 [Variovorax sp. J22R133]|uniref:hypothetical protein n=1 Tax=Variovorax brevis TaxID=3053503 RepID=UPI002574C780|nr:hypothetical protein [Variovorax sp. J22R133]MDM0112954.1 hypothetical protein [Variovorax sp. J22R133]
MPLFDLINHLANFVAPAFFLAVVLVLGGRMLMGKSGGLAMWAQCAITFIAGGAVLVGGLVWFGRDGKMLTYAALVGVCGTVQWLAGGGLRR